MGKRERQKRKSKTKFSPPNDLPAYRLLTGPDDAAFCHRVSEALAMGYELYGSPAATFNGEHVIVAQALVWSTHKSEVSHRGAEYAEQESMES